MIVPNPSAYFYPEILEEVKYPPREEDTQSLTNKQSKYKQMWSLKVVHLLAFFIFAYCGIEVTMGGALNADAGVNMTWCLFGDC